MQEEMEEKVKEFRILLETLTEPGQLVKYAEIAGRHFT